jgi:hypothetical protein
MSSSARFCGLVVCLPEAATGASRVDAAHPEGGRQAEPERSERLARSPAMAPKMQPSAGTRPARRTSGQAIATLSPANRDQTLSRGARRSCPPQLARRQRLLYPTFESAVEDRREVVLSRIATAFTNRERRSGPQYRRVRPVLPGQTHPRWGGADIAAAASQPESFGSRAGAEHSRLRAKCEDRASTNVRIGSSSTRGMISPAG